MKFPLRDERGRFCKPLITSNMFIGSGAESEATGTDNSRGYLQYAMNRGFNHIEVLDWSSSAGDWQFLISRNGYDWQILHQTNNYPLDGFSYHIEDDIWCGTVEQAYKQIEEIYSGKHN